VIQAWHIVIVIAMAGRVQRTAGAPGSETFRRVILARPSSKEDDMFYVSPSLFQGRTSRLALLLVSTLTLIVFAADPARAQRTRTPPPADPEDHPAFAEFKGVRLGMTADDSRKKLGSPRDKSAEQDFYVFNDTQAVQVFYDKAGVVSAISIDFMSGASGIPSAKEVLGAEAETRADGSVYRMMRYPKAGYWVSYSRTAGNSPTITITMQKIEH
jgi:hypothetical protein